MPILYMLVGIPGSGKSFFVQNNLHIMFPTRQFVILSTDNFIDAEAASQSKTYGEVFKSSIKRATQSMNADLAKAVKNGDDIIWDQVNVTAKSRAAKLAQIPDTYHKVAVVFPTPDNEELERRLASRPGKTIPYNIVMGMMSQLERPTIDEGFDEVVTAYA